jgi:hypothetical protein
VLQARRGRGITVSDGHGHQYSPCPGKREALRTSLIGGRGGSREEAYEKTGKPFDGIQSSRVLPKSLDDFPKSLCDFLKISL